MAGVYLKLDLEDSCSSCDSWLGLRMLDVKGAGVNKVFVIGSIGIISFNEMVVDSRFH